ncbi:MAG: PorV/PorQ family protein [candidate division KSB1 bacterium]|nr:PorV/PorQ family protein [candidate division KSB1 bacterium]MDZ7300956.1 PorV/PorQ family protein [candidate division KSB1 bacterium]MDZ7310366.1 PorV/PorQ family protein [candidate division KSB1 bacterium]
MRTYILMMGVVITALAGAQSDLYAQKKLAQTGFQFLSVGTEARAAAMAEAFTTVAGNSSSIFYNPANMARGHAFLDIAVSRNEWIAEIVHHSASVAINPAGGEYGVFAISALSVDYGDFFGTMVDPTTEKGYVNTGTFSPSAYAIGLGYARALSDRFSVGGHIKYVSQSLGSSVLPVLDNRNNVISTDEVKNELQVLAFDFGTVYQTGFKSLAFGMTVRNFSKEVKYQNEGFQLPLTFKIGISMNVLDLFMEQNDQHSFLVAVDAIHPRDYSEQLNIGGEYVFMNMLALRAGYNYNYDERNITTGFGLQKAFGAHSVAIDYAYTPFGVFDSVNRFSFRLGL